MQFFEAPGDGLIESDGIGILDALRIDVGRKSDADPVHADFVADGGQHLGHEAQSAVDRSAVGIGAEVGAVAQELVDQIAVRAVDLDAVEPGDDGVARGPGVIGDDPPDVVVAGRARFDIRLLAFVRVGEIGRASGRRRHGLHPADARMDHPAHVPQLGDDAPTLAVNGLGRELPAGDLIVGPQPRRVGPAEAFAADPGRFGNDQAGAGALRIIERHQLVGHALTPGARPGQRRHDEAVRQLDRAELKGIEQSGHANQILLCSPAAHIGPSGKSSIVILVARS